MANEVTIAVGAKADDAKIKAASVNVLEAFGNALKGLENVAGTSAKKVRKELESIQTAYSLEDLSDEAEAYFQELAKSLNALTKVDAVTGKIEVDFRKVHAVIGEVASKSEDLSKHVKTIEEDLPEGGAMKGFGDALSGVDSGVAGVVNQLENATQTAKRFGQAFSVSGIKGKIVGIAAGIAAVAIAVGKAIRSWVDYNREIKQAKLESFISKENNAIEVQNSKLQTKLQKMQAIREAWKNEQEAVNQVTEAVIDLDMAKRRATALSAAERNAVENEANERKNALSGKRSIEDIENKKKEDEDRIKQLQEEIKIKEREIRVARKTWEEATSIGEQFYEDSAEDESATWGTRTARNVIAIFGGARSSEEQQSMWVKYKEQAQTASKEMQVKAQEIAQKEMEISMLEKRLNGGVYEKQIEAAKKREEAAKAELEAAKKQQEVQIAAEKLARERELQDRADRLNDMQAENRIALEESDGGYAAKKHAIYMRAKLAQEQRDREELRYSDEAIKEVTRLGREDELEGLSEPDKRNRAIEIIQGTDESKLSDAAKTARSRYETVQQNAKEARVTAQGRLDELQREGDAKTAELMMQSRKGGSRLTAMGLGGGDSPQKETAKNTRKMVGQLSKMVSLLEPGDKSLGANRSLGASWSIL